MKKIIFIFAVIIIAAVMLYKLDIKPQVTDVIKEVKITADNKQKTPAESPKKTLQIPSQNEVK